ncbi:MAG: response regulator [Alphaproteobacteria bacterium]|nr:response regulator [Alphaproteobacteria bacterium]
MNVLVVDKDQLATRILTRKLENWGYVAFTATNAYEAERIIERESIRMVVTEIDLPGRSGTELVQLVRGLERPRYTYLIILTGNTETTELLDALESGADDLLRKPLNVFEMRIRIKAAKRMLNMEDELREGAGTDGTTGLVNRNSFRQFFRVIVAENGRTKATGALMYIHVANYTTVRKAHGYKAAEFMMRAVSIALGEIVRTADLAARLSDESFGLCLQNTDWPTCRIVGKKAIAKAESASLVFEGIDLRPKLLVETVNFPSEGLNSDDIMETAPRFAFDGGDAVSPNTPEAAPPPSNPAPDPDPAGIAESPSPEAAPTEAPVGDLNSDMADVLRRAGIDVDSYGRLSAFEQQQVLKLAEQLAGASPE